MQNPYQHVPDRSPSRPAAQTHYVTEYRPPTLWPWYTLSIVMMVLAIIAPCAGVITFGVMVAQPAGKTFVPPAAFDVSVTSSETMHIWIDESDEKLSPMGYPKVPDDFIATVTGPDGGKVELTEPSEDTTSYTMGTSRTAVRSFVATTPGTYRVDVQTTLPSGQSVAVSPDDTGRNAERFGTAFVITLLIAVAAFIIGLVLLIVTIVRHSKASSRAKAMLYT